MTIHSVYAKYAEHGLSANFKRVGRQICDIRHQELITHAEMFTLASWAEKSKHPPYDFLITDEAQDLSIEMQGGWSAAQPTRLRCRMGGAERSATH